MEKYTDLGTVKKRHCSGMMETDTGFRLASSATVEIGDQLVKEGARKFFVKKADWAELNSETKVVYKKGVTKKLIAEALSYGIIVTEAITKDEVLAAIEDAKSEDEGEK